MEFLVEELSRLINELTELRNSLQHGLDLAKMKEICERRKDSVIMTISRCPFRVDLILPFVRLPNLYCCRSTWSVFCTSPIECKLMNIVLVGMSKGFVIYCVNGLHEHAKFVFPRPMECNLLFIVLV